MQTNFPGFNFWRLVKYYCIFVYKAIAYQIATFNVSGELPWPPVPITVMFNTVISLITGPYWHHNYPKGAVGQLWNPYTSSTPSKQPS